MPDDKLQTVSWDVEDEAFTSLGQDLEASYSNSGASDETLLRLEQYLNAVLTANELASAEIQNPAVRDELVAILMDNLNVGYDPTIESGIQNYLDNLALQKAVVSVDPPQRQRHQTADPVDMFSGQFVHEIEDISIDGAGMNFVFRRVYKHQAKYWGPLGAKWDHSYNLWIRQVGTNVIRSSGSLREDAYTRHPKFGQAGYSYWVPPAGVRGVIEERETPLGFSFFWRSPEGVKCYYTPGLSNPFVHLAGRIEDRFGNYLDLEYDPNKPGRLVQVLINHPERVVVFDYDSMGRIEKIRDYAGRSWSYAYDDFGDLVAFTLPATEHFPNGSTTYYGYTSNIFSGNLQHNLARIVDPAGRVYVENEYGTGEGLLSYNRVVRQRLGPGETYFEYEQVVNEFEHSYTDSEAPWSQVNFVERNGHPIHYVYNKFGNLLLKEEYVIEDGSRRLLRWRYRYNRDGALTGMLSPEGSITQYYYGRDHYLRAHGITDEEIDGHGNLTFQERLAFDNLLAMVRRGKFYTFEMMNLNRGVWGDFFPDILASDPNDVVTKYTYESYYQQIWTMSDPRFTQRADPGYAELPSYSATLTHHEYLGPFADPHRLLARVRYPSLKQADGTILPSATEEFISYDARGRLRRQVDRAGVVTETTYFGVADGIKEGYVNRRTVDPSGLAVTTEFEVNEVGIVTAIHHPRSVGAAGGRFVTRFDVNERNQSVRTYASRPFSYVTESRYDPSGLVERVERDILDEQGSSILGGKEVQLFRYNEQKDKAWESVGGDDTSAHHITKHRYNETDCLIATFTPAGGVVRRRYDARLLQRAIVRGSGSPNASTTKAEVDGDGRKKRSISARGFRTTFHYDPLGRIHMIQDALGNETHLSHDKAGNITTERFFEQKADGGFALLSRRECAYDELNRLIREGHNLFRQPLPVTNTRIAYLTSPGPGILLQTEHYYDVKGRLVRTVNPKDQSTYTEYDTLDRKKAETDDLGNRIETRYDAHGNVTRRDIFESVIDPVSRQETSKELFSTAYEYDELDRMIALTDSIGNITQHAYDSRNNVVRTTDPLGNVIRYEHDVYNRKVHEIRELTDTGLGSGAVMGTIVTQFEYDENGNLSAHIDGNGNRVAQVFDALDRRTSVVYADASTYRTEYDADDNIVVIEDNNGLIRRFTYDALGRTFRVDADRSGLAPGVLVEGENFEQYSYDGMGRTLSEINDFAAVLKKVDSLGRVFEESVAFISPAMAGTPRTIQRQNDELSAIRTLVYPDNRVIQYDRDALNRVVRIINVAKGTAYPGSNAFSDPHDVLRIDFRGQRSAFLRCGNGASTGYQYDASGRLIHTEHRGPGGAPLLTMQQLFDGAGNMRFRRDIDPAGTTADRFEYDSTYRLTRIKSDTIPNFNPVSFAPATPPPMDPIPDRQAVIDASLGSLAQDLSNSTFAYDPAANRMREQRPGRPAVNYVTNPLDEYQHVGAATLIYDRNGNLISQDGREFIYDARNLLVRVHDSAAGLDLVRYFHDCRGRRIAEARNSHVVHLCGMASISWRNTRAACCTHSTSTRAITDAVCQMVQRGAEYWFHKDLIGSTRLLTDGTGAPVGRHRYDPFGIVTADSAPFNRVCFTGRRFDREIGMYDFRAREYYAALGRFLQRDPKGFDTGFNTYEYAWDNALRFVDPLGTEPKEFFEEYAPARARYWSQVQEEKERSQAVTDLHAKLYAAHKTIYQMVQEGTPFSNLARLYPWFGDISYLYDALYSGDPAKYEFIQWPPRQGEQPWAPFHAEDVGGSSASGVVMYGLNSLRYPWDRIWG